MKPTIILAALLTLGLSVHASAADEPCPAGPFPTDPGEIAKSFATANPEPAELAINGAGWPQEIARIKDGIVRWYHGVNILTFQQAWTAYDARRHLFIHIEAKILRNFVNPELTRAGPGQTLRQEGDWTYIITSIPASQSQTQRIGCLINTLLSLPPPLPEVPVVGPDTLYTLTYDVLKDGPTVREEYREERPFRWLSLVMSEPLRKGQSEWLPPRVGTMAIDAQDNIYALVDTSPRLGPRIDVVKFGPSWGSKATTMSARTPQFGAGTLVVDQKGHVLLPSRSVASLYELSPGMSVPDPIVERPLRLDRTDSFADRISLHGLAIDQNDNLYLQANSQLIRMTTDGAVTYLAGQTQDKDRNKYADGQGADAGFFPSAGMALTPDGTLFMVDYANSTIRKITSDGLVTTFAGEMNVTGSQDGQGAAARFNHPVGIATDRQGVLYVADSGNDLIRRISSLGEVTTLAGTPGVAGYLDGKGSTAQLFHPAFLVVDSHGTVFVSNDRDNFIRKISPQGRVTTWDVGKSIPKLGPDELL